MKILKDSQDCCGCEACANACPVKAISMQPINGFLYPVIDESRCIDCGRCRQICPVINVQYNNLTKPLCYAACAEDAERVNSSSGGAFSILAKHVLKTGGIVVGAAFNEKWGVNHILIDNAKDLEKLRGSKYLQSSMGSCYKPIKENLKKGNTVLFSGTPCQIGGLKSFLGNEYPNLYCIDVVCHGVSSPSVWQQYLSENFSDVSSVNFRDKTRGWKNSELSICYHDDKIYAVPIEENEYMMSFLTHMNLRKSCTSCPFSRIPRQGDITIGDFWGIKQTNRYFADDKGVSLLLINNEKGKKLFDAVKENFSVVEQKSLENAYNENPNLISSSVPNPNSDRFFEMIQSYSVNSTYHDLIFDRVDVLIMNYWRYLNVGAMMTAYALQHTLNQLGFTNKLISYCHKKELNSAYEKSPFKRFEQKYLRTTAIMQKQQLKSLNNKANNFIVGSDQIWNSVINSGDMAFFLDFVNPDKRKIACSASLGSVGFSSDIITFELEKHYIHQFDAISVREDESKAILENTFNIASDHILDPVFALTKDDYITLANDSSMSLPERYIAIYSILPLDTISKEIDYLKNRYKAPLVNININNSSLDLVDWIKAIQNCELLVTDSFHGLCFALIFNKPFICVNMNNSSVRLLSLCRTFGISDHLWCVGEDISNEFLHAPIDYQTINNIMSIERKKIRKWLKTSLTADKKLSFDHKGYLINHLIDKINEHSAFIQGIQNREFTKQILKYKLLYKFTFGKKRKHYKNRYKELKNKLQG